MGLVECCLDGKQVVGSVIFLLWQGAAANAMLQICLHRMKQPIVVV